MPQPSGSYIPASPIAFTPPSITKPDKTVKTFPAKSYASLYYTVEDDTQLRVSRARIRDFPLPIALWGGTSPTPYNDAWTDTEVQAAITAFLGANPAAALLKLFPGNH